VIGSAVDTDNKFITGVVDTAEQRSPVTTTPVINFSPVQTTKTIAGDNNTGNKFIAGINDTDEQ
jgi:hypothetical protein